MRRPRRATAWQRRGLPGSRLGVWPRWWVEDQVREPGQVIFLFGDESVHRRGRVAQCRPRSLGDIRGENGPVEVEIAVPQRFPAFSVVGSDRLMVTSLVMRHLPLLAR